MKLEGRFELNRFISAQAGAYSAVLTELKAGNKRSHWMWFVFPQLDGLGSSITAKHYAIKSLDEAREYLQHPVLGIRLRESTETVLAVEDRTASEIFGHPDDLKFKSSMTFFQLAASQESIFSAALEKYFDGERDSLTLRLLKIDS